MFIVFATYKLNPEYCCFTWSISFVISTILDTMFLPRRLQALQHNTQIFCQQVKTHSLDLKVNHTFSAPAVIPTLRCLSSTLQVVSHPVSQTYFKIIFVKIADLTLSARTFVRLCRPIYTVQNIFLDTCEKPHLHISKLRLTTPSVFDLQPSQLLTG